MNHLGHTIASIALIACSYDGRGVFGFRINGAIAIPEMDLSENLRNEVLSFLIVIGWS
jgi:hypothetical protein